MEFIVKNIESKKVIWFQGANQYLIVDTPFYEDFIRFINGVKIDKLMLFCKDKYRLSPDEAKEILYCTTQLKLRLQNSDSKMSEKVYSKISSESDWFSYMYSFNFKEVNVQFSNDKLKEIIHPKYVHISNQISDNQTYENTIIVSEIEGLVVLQFNDELIGKWTFDEIHLLQGKFAMILLNYFNDTSDENWMAVLHASAIYKNNESIVFLGDSGSGKSIASLLLSLHGYKILVDDFAPIDVVTKKVSSFPSGTSIKEPMIKEMKPFFPQLEYTLLHSKDSKTKFKYLYPLGWNSFHFIQKECKALVFIKYNRIGENKILKISKIKALEYFIPDSWISPKKENVSVFLDCVFSLPCYVLSYSDNEQLVLLIDKLNNNEV